MGRSRHGRGSAPDPALDGLPVTTRLAVAHAVVSAQPRCLCDAPCEPDLTEWESAGRLFWRCGNRTNSCGFRQPLELGPPPPPTPAAAGPSGQQPSEEHAEEQPAPAKGRRARRRLEFEDTDDEGPSRRRAAAATDESVSDDGASSSSGSSEMSADATEEDSTASKASEEDFSMESRSSTERDSTSYSSHSELEPQPSETEDPKSEAEDALDEAEPQPSAEPQQPVTPLQQPAAAPLQDSSLWRCCDKCGFMVARRISHQPNTEGQGYFACPKKGCRWYEWAHHRGTLFLPADHLECFECHEIGHRAANCPNV